MIVKMENVPLVTVVVLLAVLGASQGMPLHASCNIDWQIAGSCESVNMKVVEAIKQYSTSNCTNVGEKCRYTLQSQSPTETKAVHETPVKHYKDDLTFTFKSGSSTLCLVHGFSTSETWYALLDQGTNYCNLHNIIAAANFANVTETTSDSNCTQYTSADCNKY